MHVLIYSIFHISGLQYFTLRAFHIFRRIPCFPNDYIFSKIRRTLRFPYFYAQSVFHFYDLRLRNSDDPTPCFPCYRVWPVSCVGLRSPRQKCLNLISLFKLMYITFCKKCTLKKQFLSHVIPGGHFVRN